MQGPRRIRSAARERAMSVVAGFNHNIKHRGQVFHVQTEDSGEASAVLVTHLFLGGTIVATRRHSYAELRGAPDLQQQVRLRMEEQHKQVLRDLVNGKFDEKVHGLTAYQPGQLALRESAGPAGAVAPLGPPQPPAENVAAANSTLFDIDVVIEEEEPAPAANGQGNAAVLDPARATLFDRAPAAAPAAQHPPTTVTARFDWPAGADPRATRFDGGVAGGQAQGRATLFDNGVAGGLRGTPPVPRPALRGPVPPRPATPGPAGQRPATPGPVGQRPVTPGPASQRPVTPGPAAPAARPVRPGAPRQRPVTPGPVATLQPAFGEDLVSEKSLDEVILAYLAGDGEEE